MKRSTKAAVVAGAVIVVTGGTMGLASAVGGESESEAPITGEALAKASAAALEHTGGGRVTDTEVGDEESYYEVEVTLPSGGETDVQLDKSFQVVGSETESQNEDEGGQED